MSSYKFVGIARGRFSRALTAFIPFMALVACSPGSPQTGSQTNWLHVCESSDDCKSGLECVCGACTMPCADDDACSDLPGSSCVSAKHTGAIALCSGMTPPSAMCLPLCDDAGCPEGTACTAGVCVPMGEPDTNVTIDVSKRFQALIGFGAGFPYTDDEVVAHPQKAALYDAMFKDAGFELIRLRNRYDGTNADDLAAPGEIVKEAADRLGHNPVVLMNEGSPPASLKANGDARCDGNEDTCTLVTLDDGTFDYAGFANHWLTSLQAYESAGVSPDYVGIQNNPNWIPSADAPGDGCKFLPSEGTAQATVDGAAVDVTYPGYSEALDAVRSAVGTDVKLLAPETTGPVTARDYALATTDGSADAIGFHLYGTDPASSDFQQLTDLADAGQQLGVPLIQSEMRSDGLGTAILVQRAVTLVGASAYVQNDFVASAGQDPDPMSLIQLSDDSFETQAPYYALRHFAGKTKPGWRRIETAVDASDLLTTAWLAPDNSALTLVLVNPATSELTVNLDIADELRELLPITEVMRTVFDGVERWASLGELGSENLVRIPARSVVTVAFSK